MSPGLQNALDAIYDSRIPERWVQVTWTGSALGLWWANLLRRHEQLDKWMRDDRPSRYWISGFYNPQGFLTSVCQEVTRLHAGDVAAWSLDEAVLTTEVTRYEGSDCERIPPEGVYVYGLHLDGAGWDRPRQKIRDPLPKAEPTKMPLIFITAESARQPAKKGPKQLSCPAYLHPSRTSANWVFDCSLNLADENDTASKWIRRGVCLLLQCD